MGPGQRDYDYREHSMFLYPIKLAAPSTTPTQILWISLLRCTRRQVKPRARLWRSGSCVPFPALQQDVLPHRKTCTCAAYDPDGGTRSSLPPPYLLLGPAHVGSQQAFPAPHLLQLQSLPGTAFLQLLLSLQPREHLHIKAKPEKSCRKHFYPNYPHIRQL